MISDAEILQRLKKDREKGIQILFERYYRPLVVYADEFVHSLSTAEDIVQDFFIRLWMEDYLDRLLPKALSSYLFVSIRNSCYTYEHSKGVWNRRRNICLSGLDIPAEVALKMEHGVVNRVNLAIAKLPEQTQTVTIRILVEEMKYKEVAAELDISVNTVKTLLRNGLRVLREELKNDYRSLFLWICYFKNLK